MARDPLVQAQKALGLTAPSAIVGDAPAARANAASSRGLTNLTENSSATAGLAAETKRQLSMPELNPAYRSPARDVLDQIGAAPRDLKPVNRERAVTKPAEKSSSAKVIGSAADIGRQVRGARRAMGMTQQRFADLAGVGRRFLIELEKGKPTLEIGRVLAVCQAAGIKIGFIA